MSIYLVVETKIADQEKNNKEDRMANTSILRLIWLGVLTALFISFWIWYGGNGTPVTVDEAKAYLDRANAQQNGGTRGAHPEAFPNLLEWAARDDGREFYMVNLEKHKKGPEAEQAARKYGEGVVPLLLARGSFPIFGGSYGGRFLDELPYEPDFVAVVRYRSLRDLLDMNADPKMALAVPHKWASIERTIVFPMNPYFSAVQVRILVAALVILLGIGGLAIIRRFE